MLDSAKHNLMGGQEYTLHLDGIKLENCQTESITPIWNTADETRYQLLGRCLTLIQKDSRPSPKIGQVPFPGILL